MVPPLYTPEQANAALPLLRLIVADVVGLAGRVAEAMRVYRNAKADPERPQTLLNEARRALSEAVEERDACLAELNELGVRMGDPVRGICDFPSELDDEPIYLCWELGEERVEYFHGRDSGFADRQPLPVPVTAG